MGELLLRFARRNSFKLCAATVFLGSFLAANLPLAANAAAPTYDFMMPTANYSHSCIANQWLCQTDNASVYYYMDSSGDFQLEADDQTVVRNMINQQYGTRTVLTIVYENNPVFSGTGETDIIYQEGSASVPADKDGVAWCNSAVSGTLYKCDQAYVQIRAGVIPKGQGLPCHETGHAVGLVHAADASPAIAVTDGMYANLSCQRNVAYPSDTLSNTGVANINYTY